MMFREEPVTVAGRPWITFVTILVLAGERRVAARFIDAAVSAVEGSFSKRDALHRAHEQARDKLP